MLIMCNKSFNNQFSHQISLDFVEEKMQKQDNAMSSSNRWRVTKQPNAPKIYSTLHGFVLVCHVYEVFEPN